MAFGARSGPIFAASSRSNRSEAAATLALRPRGASLRRWARRLIWTAERLNRPGFTGGQNSRRIARYGTDIKEEDLEAVFT
jgi:hypothetical protein